MRTRLLALKEKIGLLLQSYSLKEKDIIDISSILNLLNEINSNDVQPQDKIDLIKYSLSDKKYPDSLTHLIFLSHNKILINSFYGLLSVLNKQGIQYDDIAEKILFKNPGPMLTALATAANKDELFIYLSVLKKIYEASSGTKSVFRDYLMFPCINFSGQSLSLYETVVQSKNPNLIFELINANILHAKDYALLQDYIYDVYQELEKMVYRVSASEKAGAIGKIIIDMLVNPQNPFYSFFSFGKHANPLLLKLRGLVNKLGMEKELVIAAAPYELNDNDSVSADASTSSEDYSVTASFYSDLDFGEQDDDPGAPLLPHFRAPSVATTKKTGWNRVHNFFVNIISPVSDDIITSAQANFDQDAKEDDRKCLHPHDKL